MSGAPETVDALVRAVRLATGVHVSRWRDLGGSFTTNLALTTDDGVVVARVHPAATSADRITAQQAARRALDEAGVPTVVAVALVRLPDGRLVEVEPFVDASDRMKTPSRLVTGFTVLARVHDVLRTADLPAAAESAPWANHVRASDAAAVTAAAAAELRAMSAGHGQDLAGFADDLTQHISAVAALEEHYSDHQVVHLTHGDFWDDNVLFDGGHAAAVLDLGFMASRARIDDLALPFWFWLLEPGHGPPTSADVHLLARLADAYDAGAREPLSAQERAALPLAVARQPAWSAHHWLVERDPAVVAARTREASAELPVARAVLAGLPAWQRALSSSAR